MSVHPFDSQILDGYRLIRLRTRGVFSEVWLCRSEAMGGYHTLKFISGSDPDLLEKGHNSGHSSTKAYSF
jgi:hypothetical protein